MVRGESRRGHLGRLRASARVVGACGVRWGWPIQGAKLMVREGPGQSDLRAAGPSLLVARRCDASARPCAAWRQLGCSRRAGSGAGPARGCRLASGRGAGEQEGIGRTNGRRRRRTGVGRLRGCRGIGAKKFGRPPGPDGTTRPPFPPFLNLYFGPNRPIFHAPHTTVDIVGSSRSPLVQSSWFVAAGAPARGASRNRNHRPRTAG